MGNKVIGNSNERWDAIAKVKGTAMFTDDFPVKNMLHGKILRSTIAHGYVKNFDISEALKVPGVLKILLPEDVPNNKFSTAGHPWNLNPVTRDKEDRQMLTRRVRQCGDEIAGVIAETELAALQALEKIKVTYEEYPVYLTPAESLAEGAKEIHDGSKNIIASTVAEYGEIDKGFADADYIIEQEYLTPVQQHCHMESQIAYAYQDSDQRYTCVSSTQIPHICRRVIGQAMGERWSNFRVIKPFIGGGFGNKQDVTVEPLAVAMSKAMGGRPVKIILSREESIAFTRTRHSIDYKLRIGIKKDGKITAFDGLIHSNQGGYASHGHAIGGKGGGFIHALYQIPNFKYAAKTVYTNIATAGAMRGYGIPQVMFALESLMEEAAKTAGIDSIEFRKMNLVPEGTYNKLNEIYQFHNKLGECLDQGRKEFDWDRRKRAAESFKHESKRRGVGVATFSYGTGTYPKGLEVAGCRINLMPDGCVKYLVGATEIGQGSDTVFAQMISETLGIPFENIRADKHTDTDIAPVDTGAYASRQSYVTGFAVKKAAEKMRKKIFERVKVIYDREPEYLDIVDGNIVYKHNGQLVATMADFAMLTYYHMAHAKSLTAEASVNCHENSYAFGATFCEVEVDIMTGKIEVIDILNVHDSGTILNPLLAEGQVEGGMVMGIAFGLSEELKYNKKGIPLNNNLLDYKMPTTMDVPDLGVSFVIDPDPIAPYGNKSLGENPLCSPAPALRNAVVHATGVQINTIPLAPQKVFEHLKKAGVIK